MINIVSKHYFHPKNQSIQVQYCRHISHNILYYLTNLFFQTKKKSIGKQQSYRIISLGNTECNNRYCHGVIEEIFINTGYLFE